MKIGIMGGTFDPIHNGHLMLGEYAYRDYELDEVWFLPNGNPPHKNNPAILKSTDDRVKMTELAIANVPYFRIITYETDRTEPSYSYQTMEHFRSVYPQHEFYFILGADSLFDIEKWRNPDQFLKLATILAAYRDDADNSRKLNGKIEYLNRKYGADIRLLRTPLLHVSSHEIREAIRNGNMKNIPVPKAVLNYIEDQHLYQGDEYDRNINENA